MAIASALFLISFVGLVGLFGLKEWEVRNNRVLLPLFRQRLDRWAQLLKELLAALRKDAEKLPPELLHLSRIILHEIALFVGGTFHFLAQQAHRLADFVSHKRNFVRRAPRSEFLTKVMEHKSGGDTEHE